LETAQTIQKMINPDVDIHFEPLPQDDPRRRRPNIDKAYNLLNWKPTVPLLEGLQSTIEDFRTRLELTGSTSTVDYVRPT
jgi:UDP-glucuronate decarboxylase